MEEDDDLLALELVHAADARPDEVDDAGYFTAGINLAAGTDRGTRGHRTELVRPWLIVVIGTLSCVIRSVIA